MKCHRVASAPPLFLACAAPCYFLLSALFRKIGECAQTVKYSNIQGGYSDAEFVGRVVTHLVSLRSANTLAKMNSGG
jgi:hypothetical protein